MMEFPQCVTCLHLRIDPSRRGMFCAAFPEGIPAPIKDCDVQHDAPYPGDHGLQYEFDPDWASKVPRSAGPRPKSILLD